MNANERKFNDLTQRILGAVFEVANTLGTGGLMVLKALRQGNFSPG